VTRLLTVVDERTREELWVLEERRIDADTAGVVLERLVAERASLASS
jgi:hypothetical protein